MSPPTIPKSLLPLAILPTCIGVSSCLTSDFTTSLPGVRQVSPAPIGRHLGGISAPGMETTARVIGTSSYKGKVDNTDFQE